MFLAEHGYETQLTQKQLLSPSTKDFLSILTFLVQQIDPRFVLPEKDWDEDLLNVLKTLRYPVAISKRILLSVGSPHTWPHLLAALMWLVELLTMVEQSNAQEAAKLAQETSSAESVGIVFLEDEERGQRMFFDFCGRSYVQFMGGVEEEAILDRELLQQFASSNDAMDSAIAKLEREDAELSEKLEKYRREPTPLSVVETKRKDYLDDIGKFETLNGKLVAHKSSLERKVEEKTQETMVRESELAAVAQRKKDLQATLEQQDAQQIDAQQIARDRRLADEQLRSTASTREMAAREVFEKEVELSSLVENLEKRVGQFRDLRVRLSKFDEEAALPPMSIVLDTDKDTDEGVLGIDYRGIVKPALRRLKEVLQAKNREATSILLRQAEEDLARVQERRNDKAEDVSALEAKLQRLELQYKTEKDAFAEKLRQMDEEMRSIELFLNEIRRDLGSGVREAELLVQMKEEEYQTSVEQWRQERKTMNELILGVLDELTRHKEHIQELLQTLPFN